MIKKANIILFLIVLALAGSLYLFNNEISKPNDNPFGKKDFVIEQGQGVADIADNLQSQGFLKHTFLFKVYVWMKDEKASFIDGTFDLKTDMSIAELVKQLHEQQQNKEVSITVTEGMDVAEIDGYLSDTIGVIKKGELIDLSANYDLKSHLFLIDRPKDATLEGYLYPDTYRIYKQTTVDDITEKMLANFDAKLTEDLRAEIKKQGKSLNEVLTLASIVEKEMFGYENRRVVAGIFLNRIKTGMPLQSDATINFFTGTGKTRSTREETAIDNPYNTYKYYGLPPGPICNPSIEAIKSVIYPAKTDYLYFLTSPSGEIYFAKTYDQHLINTQKYLN
jgi:UPF0755 protein